MEQVEQGFFRGSFIQIRTHFQTLGKAQTKFSLLRLNPPTNRNSF